jgi:hypothetical protein
VMTPRALSSLLQPCWTGTIRSEADNVQGERHLSVLLIAVKRFEKLVTCPNLDGASAPPGSVDMDLAAVENRAQIRFDPGDVRCLHAVLRRP